MIDSRQRPHGGELCVPSELQSPLEALENLQSAMERLVDENSSALANVHPENRASATNLLHYLALRRHDVRELQKQLTALGLSSLGRTESQVLSGVRTVMRAIPLGKGRALYRSGPELGLQYQNDTNALMTVESIL